ncbi:MAG: formylglycine-generating enzyme family protein [Oceanococcus sp.]
MSSLSRVDGNYYRHLRLALLAVSLACSELAFATGADMLLIPGGSTVIGSDQGLPDERPKHAVTVAAFELDKTPVTVAAFAQFVKDTQFQTTAEQLNAGSIMQFGTGRWHLQAGAFWRTPQGLDQNAAPENHPVTQVSWDDAQTYCAWAGKRLPSEYEWEHAARAGQSGEPAYAFGEELLKEGQYLANVWTGVFPVINTKSDGYKLTSPVGVFGLTPIGLADMAGNVWEWTSSDYAPYPQSSNNQNAATEKVQRGGSYLCDPNFCHGFRVSARGHATTDSSLMHVGFRCARTIKKDKSS